MAHEVLSLSTSKLWRYQKCNDSCWIGQSRYFNGRTNLSIWTTQETQKGLDGRNDDAWHRLDASVSVLTSEKY